MLANLLKEPVKVTAFDQDPLYLKALKRVGSSKERRNLLC